MEKINIAELLKDCPQGMELDCTKYSNVYFVGVDYKKEPKIKLKIETWGTWCSELTLDKYGKESSHPNAKCLIYPKGKTTWDGFVPPCKFKVGDRIVQKNGVCVPILISNVGDEFYYTNTESSVGVLPISKQDDWELAPNKFDISTLNSFDKVLVRLTKDGVWNATFFSHYDKEVKWGCYPFVTTSSKSYSMCIPYNKDTKYLTGTKNDCADFYKTWE